jgi:hypothetical protein
MPLTICLSTQPIRANTQSEHTPDSRYLTNVPGDIHCSAIFFDGDAPFSDFPRFPRPIDSTKGGCQRGRSTVWLGPSKAAGRPKGEWNSAEITCQGPEISVKVNGVLVSAMNCKTSVRRGSDSPGMPAFVCFVLKIAVYGALD